jgi:hypothetical protein
MDAMPVPRLPVPAPAFACAPSILDVKLIIVAWVGSEIVKATRAIKDVNNLMFICDFPN